MGRITTHVLDISAGTPAAGMRIELYEFVGAAPCLIMQTRANQQGRCERPLVEGSAMHVGRYMLTFHVAEYFREHGVALREPPFLDEIELRFGISAPEESYHVPLLVSPWSYSTYRGS